MIVVGAALVIVVAYSAVGIAVKRTIREPTPTPYQLMEAVEYVVDHVPTEVKKRVSSEDVSQVLQWHLDWFIDAGLSTISGTFLGDPALVERDKLAVSTSTKSTSTAATEGISDSSENTPALSSEDEDTVVVDTDAAVDAVVARSLEADGPESVDVVCVLYAHCEYLGEIGALTVCAPTVDDKTR